MQGLDRASVLWGDLSPYMISCPSMDVSVRDTEYAFVTTLTMSLGN